VIANIRFAINNLQLIMKYRSVGSERERLKKLDVMERLEQRVNRVLKYMVYILDPTYSMGEPIDS
jgi:hypothetical protein